MLRLKARSHHAALFSALALLLPAGKIAAQEPAVDPESLLKRDAYTVPLEGICSISEDSGWPEFVSRSREDDRKLDDVALPASSAITDKETLTAQLRLVLCLGPATTFTSISDPKRSYLFISKSMIGELIEQDDYLAHVPEQELTALVSEHEQAHAMLSRTVFTKLTGWDMGKAFSSPQEEAFADLFAFCRGWQTSTVSKFTVAAFTAMRRSRTGGDTVHDTMNILTKEMLDAADQACQPTKAKPELTFKTTARIFVQYGGLKPIVPQ